jgi:hypothetical protein
MAPPLRLVTALAAAAALAGGSARAAVLPQPVLSAVHGRVVGWAQSPPDWFAVYVDHAGSGWCGLDGASWRLGLVGAQSQRLVSTQRLGSAMCGNSLAWVRSGRFSDGRHREVAFMLWSTPSIGATTYVYRIEGRRLVRLASFAGDRVTLGRGTVTASFENAGRNPYNRLTNVYHFVAGRYRLTGGH